MDRSVAAHDCESMVIMDEGNYSLKEACVKGVVRGVKITSGS